ncbi:MAG: YbaB/EbfC family nucleoid-associated protein [Cytophagaceae bacterium]|nr:YbaB/EbfC family nucleoid-associated protein [Cytophagaceae bacterium]MBK9511562.1 YbaB/EbfC family nucleoid-associated protein [Cytophagaceae bacterium]MBK9932947.1 YbaB/EbfC family nucleoid-associated protein [Cytophagaceae bacterium]MBL0303341.1 YbaB/EbfC family nucleoid-associated protein [Cytophagaceae bacterium]MBL0326191.1 YbaB/EbfC family nucleoid-associated protein [Cytophagaceae bacterium]
MFDMMGMMGKVKEMQSKMQEAQEKLADITAEGESGGGMVKVIVNGKKELVAVEIEPILMKPEDVKIVQDLIVAASNIAMEKAEVLAKQEMSKITEGVLPKIPGLDLGDLFKK